MKSATSDSGLTMVEVLVSSALLLVCLTMFGGSLVTSQRAQATNQAYSRANDQAQLAFQAIDRQVRSGFVVGTTSVVNADAAVKIYSEASGTPRCIAWVVADANISGATGIAGLYTASWNPTVNGAAMPGYPGASWRLMATDLWNWLVPTQVQPFSVSNPGAGMLKTLVVDFRLNATDRVDATVDLTSTFTSRNLERESEKIATTGVAKSAAC